MTGLLKAVVFDWAGTVVDFGSRAPMGVFVKTYAEFGVDITVAEARGPMGLAKRDHIAALMALPRISAAWAARHGHAPGEADIDRVYEVFLPMNVAVAADFSEMIPGAVDTVRELRRRGLKIGSTTGYTREIMAKVLPRAAAAGYEPDNLVCAGDLAQGRPSPLMMYRTMADLGVYPPSAIVKVDDTTPGIEEGLAAGTWTVGITASGNEVGLSLEEWLTLSPADRRIAARPAATETTELLNAIPARQSTRAEYDGKPVASDDLKRLQAAALSDRVRPLLLTDRPALESVLDFVIQGNTAQMSDEAFVDELEAWIRFNGTDAVRLGDGLFGKSSGNPEVPACLGGLMFGFFFTPKAENKKYVKHLRSSAGVAVFACAREDKAHWVEVGRSCERFALLATAPGIRTAHVNMPVEVASLRPEFAEAIGLGRTRPDLVIRFGRGPTLPPSLRPPVEAVLV